MAGSGSPRLSRFSTNETRPRPGSHFRGRRSASAIACHGYVPADQLRHLDECRFVEVVAKLVIERVVDLDSTYQRIGKAYRDALAISISGPVARVTLSSATKLAPLLKRVARDLASEFGKETSI